MDKEEFYLVSDNDYLVTLLETEIAFVKNHWMSNGRPTIVIMLTNQMLGNLDDEYTAKADERWRYTPSGRRNLLNFIISLNTGMCKGSRVRVGRLSEMVNTACIESMDFLLSKDNDWHEILKRGHSQAAKNLKDDDSAASSPVSRGRSLRKFNLISELDVRHPLATEQKSSQFLLLDQNDELSAASESRSPSPVKGEFSPTLGDMSQLTQAEDLLKISVNLADQADLLHYFKSTVGLAHKINGLSTVQALLEEVYQKAMQNKEWSIVRQTAGLLRKDINSLTANISDLLVRQKPVTIGFRPKEYFIDNPKSPNELSEIIFTHCINDPRGGPLTQEIITYLGSFIKSSPSLFDGIMRIRINFFIIALREEISRMVRCNEKDAMDHMMELSPFEMKSMLEQILSSGGQNIPANIGTPLYSPTRGRWESGELPVMELASELIITAQSGGYSAGNFAKFTAAADGSLQPVTYSFGRGLNCIVIDPFEGAVLELYHFDTHITTEESEQFVKRIELVAIGFIVVVIAKDDFVECLTESARLACESLGSKMIRDCNYRDSWCIIGEKGAALGAVPESHMAHHQGPSQTISLTVDLNQKRSQFPEVNKADNPFGPINSIMPSAGRWHRRRKNDGALNRVPADFYPKVWRILRKTTAIQAGSQILNSEPTVSVCTPEEFNFGKFL